MKRSIKFSLKKALREHESRLLICVRKDSIRPLVIRFIILLSAHINFIHIFFSEIPLTSLLSNLLLWRDSSFKNMKNGVFWDFFQSWKSVLFIGNYIHLLFWFMLDAYLNFFYIALLEVRVIILTLFLILIKKGIECRLLKIWIIKTNSS